MIETHRGLPAELGRTLENARIEAGLSRRTVAAAVGVSVPTIFRYERGQRTPSQPVARALTAVLLLDKTTAQMLDALARPEVS